MMISGDAPRICHGKVIRSASSALYRVRAPGTAPCPRRPLAEGYLTARRDGYTSLLYMEASSFSPHPCIGGPCRGSLLYPCWRPIYIGRHGREASSRLRRAPVSLYIDIPYRRPDRHGGRIPLGYSRSSVVSLICWRAKNDRMSTTAGWRIRVSIANLEKCARSATWMRSR